MSWYVYQKIGPSYRSKLQAKNLVNDIMESVVDTF